MFSLATDAAPGRPDEDAARPAEDVAGPNEDFVLATTDLAIVVDGAGTPGGSCEHGVPWFSRQLATQTMAALVAEPEIPLAEGLARGIKAVAKLHVYTCDLDAPTAPRAAVGILRIGPGTVDTLALSSCVIVVDTIAGPQTVDDPAIDELAASDPQTAHRARTKSYPRSVVRRAAAFSDGATRPVDGLGLYRWPAYLDLLDELGPTGLLRRVRALETADPDDATVATWTP